MNSFFSVIVCSYNRAQLLPRALDSLLAQSESDWEAIVVDDGSTDETEEVVRRYTSICPNIRLFQRTLNRGPGAARNIGITISTGRFVTFLDSDDEYSVDHLLTRKGILKANGDIRFLHGGVKVLGDPYVVDKDDPRKRIHLSECAVGGTFFIRREVFSEIGGFDDSLYAEDAHFLEKAVAADIPIFQTNNPSYIYYRNVRGQRTTEWAALQNSNVTSLQAGEPANLE